MNINVEHQPNCHVVVHLHATAEDVAKQHKALVAEYAQRVKLPGYRPGKVPASVIEKRYGSEIRNEVERQIISDALQQAIRNEALDVLSVVGVSNQLFHDADNSFSADIELSLNPKFELPRYVDIPVKLPRVDVTEADIDHDLLHLRERYQTYEEVDRPATLDDVVVLSYDVTLDGQPVGDVVEDAPDHFKHLEEQWFLLAAEDDFLPGFYAGLEGIAKDESRDIEIELPADFNVEALQGKKIVFSVKAAGVREKHLPDVDEAFLQKIGGEDMSLDTLRKEIEVGIRRRREQARDTSKANQVLDHLANSIDFEVPQEVVNRAAQRRTNEVTQRALQQGVAQEELIKNQETILSNATNQARQDVKISFILGEVARQERLEVSGGQLQLALANIASRSGKPVKKFLKEAQKNNMIDGLREDLLLQNAIEFLKDHAKVEETEPEAEHCATHSTASPQA